MAWTPEAILALAVPGLYLKDCLHLLDRQEAALIRGWSGAWRTGFGASHFAVAGREPCMTNPFTPHAPYVRLRWSEETQTGASDSIGPAGAREQDTALQAESVPMPIVRVLACLCWLTWIALFVVLPFGLTRRFEWLSPMLPIAVAYASVSAALAVSWVRRTSLGIESRQLASISFECLVCIPYGVNILRKVAASRAETQDFLVACKRLLDDVRLVAAYRECVRRVDSLLEEAPDGSVRTEHLRLMRARISGYVHVVE